MTQYMMAVHHAGDGPDISEEEMAQSYKDTGVFNTRLQDDGQFVFANGLCAPDTATVVRVENGEVVMTDGPYLETKEHLGGFWIIEAPDLDAALKLAVEGSVACRLPVEVRPFQAEPE